MVFKFQENPSYFVIYTFAKFFKRVGRLLLSSIFVSFFWSFFGTVFNSLFCCSHKIDGYCRKRTTGFSGRRCEALLIFFLSCFYKLKIIKYLVCTKAPAPWIIETLPTSSKASACVASEVLRKAVVLALKGMKYPANSGSLQYAKLKEHF